MSLDFLPNHSASFEVSVCETSDNRVTVSA